jgi:membrane-bound metal-dependent hydrolase YbcI (DUF457 family)
MVDSNSRPVVFAVALVVLLVAHQVSDHVLQTDHQALQKTRDGASALLAMAGHLATYHSFAAILLVGTFLMLQLPLTVAGVLAGLAFSAATHGLLDRRWPVRWLLRHTGSPKFAEATTPVCGMYTADQALHQLALLISALLIATL